MTDQRMPRFELHIRPMMRLLDREKMLGVSGIDLWEYEDVRDEATNILDRLRSDMPPLRFGGPWPLEWITLFERWVESGFPKLELGNIEGSYSLRRRGSGLILTGRGELPAPGYEFWLDVENHDGVERRLVHYWEPPRGEPIESDPQPFRIQDRFMPAATLERVLVRDYDGTHVLSVDGRKSTVT